MDFEEVLTVHVKIQNALNLDNEFGDSVVMISFSGSVTGPYFEGDVLSGGIDTQIIGKTGDRHTVSARYMIEGRDFTGKDCKMYIENNGVFNKNQKDVLFRTSPKIITNSKALDFMNSDVLVGEGVSTESGVDIKIYRAV